MPTDTPRLTASEALYAFAGWLTSRREAVTFGASHEAATAAELVNEFCTVNHLAEPREDFHTRFARPPEAQPAATPQPGEREERAVGCVPTGATLREIQGACMYYRHDFGLLSAPSRASVRADGLRWLYAWQKALGLGTPIATLTRKLAEARAEIAEKENSIQGQARLVGEFAASVRAMQRQIDEARRVLSYESIRAALTPAPEGDRHPRPPHPYTSGTVSTPLAGSTLPYASAQETDNA